MRRNRLWTVIAHGHRFDGELRQFITRHTRNPRWDVVGGGFLFCPVSASATFTLTEVPPMFRMQFVIACGQGLACSLLWATSACPERLANVLVLAGLL